MYHLFLLTALLLQDPSPRDDGADKAALQKELLSFPKPKPVAAPDPKTLDDSIRRGIEFLIREQNEDGSFGNATNTKDLNIYAPVPGAFHAFNAGTTSLGICALIEAGERSSAGREALERAEAWLMENLPKVKRATPDALYNVWAHAYGIQALVRMHERLPENKQRREKIKDLIRLQIDYLDRFESVDGGWGYYDMKIGAKKPTVDSTPFTTAAVLVAFHDANSIGVKPPEKLVKSAVASIVRQRNPDFTYLYGEYLKWMPRMGINLPGGSLGRSQACNIATRYWGDTKVTDDILRLWLNRLITQNIWLDIGRKRPIPHESKFQVAGYFYYFGHYYAGLCVDALPPEDRPFYQDQLAQILLPKQEKDGSWFDYPLYNYGHAYGTSFAVMTLLRCRHEAGKASGGSEKPAATPPEGGLLDENPLVNYVSTHTAALASMREKIRFWRVSLEKIETANTLEIGDKDRVLFLGNTFLDRERQYGHLELMLRATAPGKKFTVRNFSRPGATTTDQSGNEAAALEMLIVDYRPSVVFLGYGLNEAFAGKSGLTAYVDGYRKLIARLKELGAQVVLLSPIRHEWQAEPLPDPAPHNEQLRVYCEATAKLAAEMQISYVDLFTTVVPQGRWGNRQTDNGIHLSSLGYARATWQIALSLGWPKYDPFSASAETLRNEIVRKEGLSLERFRPKNATEGLDASERARLDQLITEAEARIVDLSNKLTPPPVAEEKKR